MRQAPSGLALVTMDFRRGIDGLGDRSRFRRCRLVARFIQRAQPAETQPNGQPAETRPNTKPADARPNGQPADARPNGETKVREPVTAEPILTLPIDGGNLIEMRTLVAATADHAGLGAHRIDDLLVVATELATNAVRHAGGSGVLRLWLGGGALHCRVTDEGPGLADPERAGTRMVPTASDEGRGLWLARVLSDGLTVVVGERGTSATATFNLP